MRLSASIDLLMQLATQEAIAAEFGEIEPDHLLEGILKLAELPVQELNKIAPGENVAKELASEVSMIRQEFERRSIDTTQTRRRLRGEAGKGKTSYQGGRLHRSEPTRAIFESAAKIAEDAGDEILSARHLLEATLFSPTTAMLKVLDRSILSMPHAHAQTPLLDEYGEDLRLHNWETKYNIEAECNALIQALSLKNRRCVFVVSNSDNHVRAIVSQTALKRNVKIISLLGLGLQKTEPGTTEKLTKVLDEAAGVPETILLLPAIEVSRNSDGGRDWADFLKVALTKRPIHCICRVGQSAYQEWLNKDRAWKRLAHFMWVQERSGSAIPSEL